ncbi:MAG TPA: DUF488 domain-containing protein [Alphaproteobacteria bacterium]|nr:DUF488 domain-containing protein [Alphaproteobacteria bacterium]
MITHNSLLSQGGSVPYLDSLSIHFLHAGRTEKMSPQPKAVFTIGHSSHPIATFIALLSAHEIEALVDVRSFPGSRRNPQFNQPALREALNAAGISYHHMVSLGGKRESSQAHSAHKGRPFSTYIEYSKSERFQSSIKELEDMTSGRHVAVMCAEALWTHCHRSIIAEEMTRHGFTVTHIMPDDLARAAERSPTLPGL